MNERNNVKLDYEYMLYEVRCPMCAKMIAKADGIVQSVCPRCGYGFDFTSPNSRSLLNRLKEREASHLDYALRHSNASDLIVVDDKCNNYFMALWEAGGHSDSSPSDIIFAHTVPLTDCVIVVKGQADIDYNFRFRVLAFQDTISAINPDDIDDADEVVVGAVKMYVDNKRLSDSEAEIIVPMIVIKGNNFILIPRRDVENELFKYCRDKAAEDLSEELRMLFQKCMKVWYGIQVAILHPVVKEVFKSPKQVTYDPEKDREVHLQSGNKIYDKKYRYIKRIVVSHETVETSVFGNRREIHRRATVWFVCGHWRTYQNGTKTFIRPYLKGKDRDKYVAIMNERDRDVAVSDKANKLLDKGSKDGEQEMVEKHT